MKKKDKKKKNYVYEVKKLQACVIFKAYHIHMENWQITLNKYGETYSKPIINIISERKNAIRLCFKVIIINSMVKISKKRN